MRVVVVTGDRPRHLALGALLEEKHLLAGMVIQERERVPAFTSFSSARVESLFFRHFRLREEAEEFVFRKLNEPKSSCKRISPNELNSAETLKYVKSVQADLLVTWGCGLLQPEFLKSLNIPSWNVHGGMSPDFKGAATLFWPTFMLNPSWTGITIHQLEKKIDGGPILQQTIATLLPDEGVQMLSARTTLEGLVDLASLLETVTNRGFPQPKPQKRSGKLWLISDWRPEHLIPVYEHFDDRISNLALSGEIGLEAPSPIRPQWGD